MSSAYHYPLFTYGDSILGFYKSSRASQWVWNGSFPPQFIHTHTNNSFRHQTNHFWGHSQPNTGHVQSTLGWLGKMKRVIKWTYILSLTFVLTFHASFIRRHEYDITCATIGQTFVTIWFSCVQMWLAKTRKSKKIYLIVCFVFVKQLF